MYGPLSLVQGWSADAEYVAAFVIGSAFGFFLEQGGFGNARKLALTFYLRDMTVVKVMFSAIVTAMLGMVLLAQLGALDLERVWLNPTYLWPGIVGGVIMGFGFAIGGYCPGTAVVGAATLKVDAFFNIGGALLGMWAFGELYPQPAVTRFYQSGFLGERATLPGYFGLPYGMVAFLVVLMALAFFLASEWLERRFAEPQPEQRHAP